MERRDAYGRPLAPRSPEETGISRRALLRLRLTRAARSDIDWAGLTDRVVQGWDRPGHEPLLRALEPVAEVVAERGEAGPGTSVLDVGAGDGNVALAAARRGAAAVACDLAPAMVERGRARCAAVDAGMAWYEADAQALPFADDAFDATLSSFGAVLAPRARRVARELARVSRPGGIVVLTAWVPRGLPGRLDELVEPVVPLPDGVPTAAEWGVQETMRARLALHLDPLDLSTRTVTLRFADADACFDALVRPWLLDDAQRAALRPDFDRLLASCNNRPPEVEIDARYLLAVGRRPG